MFGGFTDELTKIGYTKLVHDRVTRQIIPKSTSDGARRQILMGAVDADIGVRHPWLPWNDQIHAFGGSQSREDIDKYVDERLDHAARSVAKGLMAKGEERQTHLAKGFGDYGGAVHSLMDRSAHFDKPVSRGKAALRMRKFLRNFAPIAPGYGGLMVGALEHLAEDTQKAFEDPRWLVQGKRKREDVHTPDLYDPKNDPTDARVLGHVRGLRDKFKDFVQVHLEVNHRVQPDQARNMTRNMYAQPIGEAARTRANRSRSVEHLTSELDRAVKTFNPVKVLGRTAKHFLGGAGRKEEP